MIGWWVFSAHALCISSNIGAHSYSKGEQSNGWKWLNYWGEWSFSDVYVCGVICFGIREPVLLFISTLTVSISWNGNFVETKRENVQTGQPCKVQTRIFVCMGLWRFRQLFFQHFTISIIDCNVLESPGWLTYISLVWLVWLLLKIENCGAHL